MVFSSPIFLFIFLPACIIAYFVFSIFKNITIKNICLLVFSILFYAYGSIDFLVILIISILANYFFSNIMSYTKNVILKRLEFIIILLLDVGLLFIFKYLNLFSKFLFGEANATHIILPIGISFYTFQVISYVCDVYNGKVKPCKNVINFALYTLLFPQLIAGPIVRYEIVEQKLIDRQVTLSTFSDGILRFMIGFTKKILFANALGRIVDIAFSYLTSYTLGFGYSVFVMMCYSMQIYLDFWAYSDMAIGIGKMFGFDFPENFNHPFTSKSITEFWTKWHITLSSFFRDYVYIPLGGNRRGLVITCINLIIVFVLSGFWHGASFNFLYWGLYNAFFLVVERIFRSKIKIYIPETIGIIYVFVVWMIGMLLFKIDNIFTIKLFIKGAISKQVFYSDTRKLLDAIFNPLFAIYFTISVLYLTPIFDIFRNTLEKAKIGVFFVNSVIIALFIIAIIEMLTTGFNPFIYFRF